MQNREKEEKLTHKREQRNIDTQRDRKIRKTDQDSVKLTNNKE